MADETTQTVLRRRAERLARPAQVAPETDLRLVRFRRIAHFAVPVESVRDVRQLRSMEALPASPRWMSGLVAWRGGPVAAIDLAAILETAADAPAHQVVIAASRWGDVALIADDVNGVVACDGGSVEAIPRGAPEPVGRFATGYIPSIGLVLDIGSLVDWVAVGLGEGGA